MEVSDQLHANVAFILEKDLQYPLYRRLCRPQSRSERYEEKQISSQCRELKSEYSVGPPLPLLQYSDSLVHEQQV
jgi:hypothetical protein